MIAPGFAAMTRVAASAPPTALSVLFVVSLFIVTLPSSSVDFRSYCDREGAGQVSAPLFQICFTHRPLSRVRIGTNVEPLRSRHVYRSLWQCVVRERAFARTAAGAATGAFTDKDDVDRGEPVWRR
jgi:hypothetical protein